LTENRSRKEAIRLNPAWATTLIEPVEITEFVKLGRSRLSSMLHFTGLNRQGYSADFNDCPHLRDAAGHFRGAVIFPRTDRLERIENLVCGKDDIGWSANFALCTELKVATGDYAGAVSFSHSGIERVENLRCGKDVTGVSAHFMGCRNLKSLTGKFPGYVDLTGSGIEDITGLTIESPDQYGRKLNLEGCLINKIPALSEPMGNQ